jgi:hypothetical protein
MAAYGYSKRIVNEHGLHELSEVTFDVPFRDLRRIADFLIDCADSAEAGQWGSSHRHLTEFDRQWDKDNPDSDVIVIHQSPAPPAVT